MEQITGTIKDIRYRNDANGYVIAVVRLEGGGTISLKGVFPQVYVGMTLTCKGTITQDARFGPQILAVSIEERPPTDTVGIQNYLIDLVPNIGPSYARQIIDAFGADTFNIIENEPERLLTIKGIGEKRLVSIVEAIKEQKAVRNIMVWLKKYDLTNALASKIHMTYGNAAIKVLEENPYRLADDIKGVAFKRADDVARRIGIPLDSPFRIHAGIRATLEAEKDAGNTFLPKEALIHIASGNRFLSLPKEKVAEQVESGEIADVIIDENGNAALSWLYQTEVNLSDDIARISNKDVFGIPYDLEAESRYTGLTYSEGQKKAIEGALSSGMFVVTGGPGTGKTSITKVIISSMKAAGLQVLMAAPTGLAAKRMSEVTGHPAKTIHRLLEYGAEGFNRSEKCPLEGDALIVDESSMIDTTLARSLLRAVPQHMRVIFVGDVDQLPPIGPGCVLRDMIDSGVVPMVRLTEIFRQARDSDIIVNAHRINRGILPKMRGDISRGDMFFIEAKDTKELSSMIVKMVKLAIPRRFASLGVKPEDIQVLSPMKRAEDPIATAALNKELQKALNAGGDVVATYGKTELRVGDRIIQTRNNYEKDIFNGDLGFVTGKLPPGQPDGAVMTASFDERTIRLTQADLLDIELAYACTVHKSQGQEYPVTVIPVHPIHYVMLKRNLIYTAVTRSKRLCFLVGTKDAVAMAVSNEDTTVRNTRLKGLLRERMPVINKDDVTEIIDIRDLEGVDDFGDLPQITAKEQDLLAAYGIPEENIQEMASRGESIIDGSIYQARKEAYAEEPQRVRVCFGLRKENGKMLLFSPPSGSSSSLTFEDAMRQRRFVMHEPAGGSTQQAHALMQKR